MQEGDINQAVQAVADLMESTLSGAGSGSTFSWTLIRDITCLIRIRSNRC
jgi:hypothetical protein